MSGYDNWKCTDPDLENELEECPRCGEGHLEGDRWEWGCSEGCGFLVSNLP